MKEKEEKERQAHISELRELLDTTVNSLFNRVFNKKNITSISKTQNGLQIVLKDQTNLNYFIAECVEYKTFSSYNYQTYENTYIIYCNEDLTRLIIRSDKRIYFVELGDGSSQKAYATPANLRPIVEEYLNRYSPSYTIP